MIEIFRKRFCANMERHPGMAWEIVEKCLNENKDLLEILRGMEESGGEPDVIGCDEAGRIIICDCSIEAPRGRRSLCYDDDALRSRTKNPPVGSAVDQAQKMGVAMMDEALYRKLQELGEFDLKTSCWIDTPKDIRQKGGALFCERRYGRVFTFHNGAESYYAVRGWRGYIRL